ncbi:hypothetical protein C8R44DRAFT_905079 [Mycena epipterygia]|nr:hypothetical protein C8R44DRAFT_905079 [Mycena epipterygia]
MFDGYYGIRCGTTRPVKLQVQGHAGTLLRVRPHGTLPSFLTNLTSLRQAGLFSAVSSAFITQIQPQIQVGDTPPILLVSQSLLYISLFATLMAALLAVLGKQWLMYYSAADRGSMEQRCITCQRKLDGIRKWKFEEIMKTFPLLLQFALLLFAAALSTFLWTVHHSLAVIVVVLTFFGFVAYMFLLISAAVSPDDCPFQTPLAPLLIRVGQLARTVWIWIKLVLHWAIEHPWRVMGHIYSACSPYFQRAHLLPHYSSHKSPSSPMEQPETLANAPFPDPSPEIPAVLWVLETSTDPSMVRAAACITPDLQWPCVDVTPQMVRLWESFLACFEHYPYPFGPDLRLVLQDIHDGRSPHARDLGWGYCTLYYVLQSFGTIYGPYPDFFSGIHMPDTELSIVLNLLSGNPDLHLDSSTPLVTRRALHVIPSFQYRDLKALEYFLHQFKDTIPVLDPSSFTDYLCCLSSFFNPMSRRDMLRMDKSQFQEELLQDLLQTIASRLKDNQICMETVTKIIEITRSLPQLDGWIDVALAASLLTLQYWGFPSGSASEAGWVCNALNTVNDVTGGQHQQWDSRTAAGISGLLNALHFYRVPPAKEHIHMLIQALSISGDISVNAAHLLLQNNMVDWYQDDNLQPILQGASVWLSLARVTADAHFLGRDFIALGYTLADISDWQSHIREDLCSWMTIFFSVYWEHWDLTDKYTSVLCNIWNTDSSGYTFIDNGEKALGLSFMVLSKTWEGFDFTTAESLNQCVLWLCCTGRVTLRSTYETEDDSAKQIIPGFKSTFSVPLQASLMYAVTMARESAFPGSEEVSSERNAVLYSIARILEDMAGKMPNLEDSEEHDRYYWRGLRAQFEEDISTLEKSVHKMSVAVELTTVV